MKIKNLIISMVFLLLTACAAKTVPLQTGDAYYNATLKVEKPYSTQGNFWRLGFDLPVADYKAFMQDANGIYFSSPLPIMAHDSLMGTIYRTGGVYYQPSQKQISLYILDTSQFDGVFISQSDMSGLKYKIIK